MFRSSLLIVLLLLIGCSSSKKSIHEEMTEVHLNRSEYAENASIFDYKVDTTRFTDEVVEIERTEFYDIPYLDSVAGTTKQLVRAMQKTTITKKETKNGVSVRHDSTQTTAVENVVADSTKKVVNKEKSKVSKDYSYLWLLVVILLAVLYFFKKKFIDK